MLKRSALNIYGEGLRTFSNLKIKDFKIKIKVSRTMKWFKEELSLIDAGMVAIGDKFNLPSQFEKDGKWSGSPDEKAEYLDQSSKKRVEINKCLDEEIDVDIKPQFTVKELESVKELTANTISDLYMLGLVIEESADEE